MPILFIPLSFLVLAPKVEAFSDINENQASFAAIRFAQDSHILSGFNDGTFRGRERLNRGQAAKIAMVAHFSQEEIDNWECDEENMFEDVNKSTDLYRYVCFGKDKNFFQGYKNNKFKPEQELRVRDFVKFFFAHESPETDKDPAWTENYLRQLSDKRAFPPSINCFDSKIERNEVAEIIHRYKNDITHKYSKTFDELNDCTFEFVNPLLDESCSGYYVSRQWSPGHKGVDAPRDNGCWISSAGEGKVEQIARSGGMGHYLIISHPNGYKTLYMHGNGQFLVSEGEEVKAGQRIMYMGSSGIATTTHLHLSVSEGHKNIVDYANRINPAGLIPL